MTQAAAAFTFIKFAMVGCHGHFLRKVLVAMPVVLSGFAIIFKKIFAENFYNLHKRSLAGDDYRREILKQRFKIGPAGRMSFCNVTVRNSELRTTQV